MNQTEKRIKAKLPGKDTGIEIKQSICDICTPGMQCGLDCYVKDGKIIKIEGTDGFPTNNGMLCTKGIANREFLYREDRILTPLRRKGSRGSGEFEPISWEEAYTEIAQKMNGYKKEFGAESVVFYVGYPKWNRPWLHRLAYSFGSPNYGTESSCCFRATEMAWRTVCGNEYRPDLPNSSTYLGWGCNNFINNHGAARGLMALKERGGKIIIVDPRETPTTQKLADIHLQLRPGTDGALALGMCNLILENGWEEKEFVKNYIYGLDEFKAEVSKYSLEETERITGVPKELIVAATKIYIENGPASGYSPSASITHHTNGFNNFRAYICLMALAGNIDRKGGMIPTLTSYLYTDCGFETKEEEFYKEKAPQNAAKRIGEKRYPFWSKLVPECQMMDFTRFVSDESEYPIKAILGFGLNDRMFPQASKFKKAVDTLDLVVSVELFMTDFCKTSADIILPACTSMERSELKGYPGGFLTCTTPAISPLGQAKSDAEIICELAEYLSLDDELLTSGYDNTMKYLISDLSVSLEELKESNMPIKLSEKDVHPYVAGTFRENGFGTESGKIELYSVLIEELNKDQNKDQNKDHNIDHKKLNPLPTYQDSFDAVDVERYPFTLIGGARLPHTIHSRLHESKWLRGFRKEPTADINPDDACRIGVKEGDTIDLNSSGGKITVKAHLTNTSLPGDIYMYHGYKEADVNELIPNDHTDPYTGFPGFRQIRCNVEKVEV